MQEVFKGNPYFLRHLKERVDMEVTERDDSQSAFHIFVSAGFYKSLV